LAQVLGRPDRRRWGLAGERMRRRCTLLFFAWMTIISFNLFTNQPSSEKGSSGSDHVRAGLGTAEDKISSDLYKGKFTIQYTNTSSVPPIQGALTMTMVTQQTGAPAVWVSSLEIALRPSEGGGYAAFEDGEFVLGGVKLAGMRELPATGVSNPKSVRLFGTQPCRLDAVWFFHDVAGRAAAALGGEVVSVDCGLSLTLDAKAIDVDKFLRKAVHYAFWANALTIIQMRCFLAQMRHTEEGTSIENLSIIGIAIQAFMDAYDSFLHLSISASSRHIFNSFAVISLLKFVLFSLLEVRYLLSIWRRRNHELFLEGWDAARQELARVYTRFYGILVIGLIVICNSLNCLGTIVIAFQGYWLPQILHDIRRGSKSALQPQFILVMSATRCLGTLYLWGCPSCIFSGDLYPRLVGSPSLTVCVSVVVLQAVQLAIMASQKRLGPRWFVPWICLPNVYNYHRPLEVPNEGADCVICMADIVMEDGLQCALTPCDHKFHRACLEQWMDIKMECPTCRTPLPPMS